MVDVFEEVEEHLRSDQYEALLRKYLPWAGGLLVAGLLIALSFWGFTEYQLQGAQKASQAYAQGLDTLQKGDANGAFTLFGQAAKSSSPIYRSLAMMQQAGIKADQKQTAAAVKLLDDAAKADTNPVIADFASLKAAYLLLDTSPYPAIEARLTPLTEAKRPYAPLAREALAVAKLMAGKVKEARGDFVVLSLLPEASDDIRERAQAAKSLIDSGTASSLPTIVKMAISMPPPPVMAPQPPAGAPVDPTPPSGAAQ